MLKYYLKYAYFKSYTLLKIHKMSILKILIPNKEYLYLNIYIKHCILILTFYILLCFLIWKLELACQ